MVSVWEDSKKGMTAEEVLAFKERQLKEKKNELEESKLPFKERIQLPHNRSLLERFKRNQRNAFNYTINRRWPRYKMEEEELFQEYLYEFFEGKTESIIDFFEKRGEKVLFDEDSYPELNKKFLNNEISKEEYWKKINFAEDLKAGIKK